MFSIIRNWTLHLQWVKTVRGKWHLVECLNYPTTEEFVPLCLPKASYTYIDGPTYRNPSKDSVTCKMCAVHYKEIIRGRERA